MAARAFEVGTSSLTAICGIPADAKYFDEAGFAKMPQRGERVLLARFDLPAQYCGMLEYFSQFWSENAKSPAQVETRGLRWEIRANGKLLYPYLKVEHILNPWGFGSFPVMLRLEENARLEFMVHNLGRAEAPKADETVGGRLLGRYWYNTTYGDVVRSRS
jgi:hypothetical protein